MSRREGVADAGDRPIAHGRRGAKTLGRTLALSAVIALVVSGCVAGKDVVEVSPSDQPGAAGKPTRQPVPKPSSPDAPGGPEATLDAFYSQDLTWSECGTFECATILAPLDWATPGAGATTIALERAAATGGSAQGSLLTNPGGPGASGIESLEYLIKPMGDKLRKEFDIIGFDPRGVGQSESVQCLDAKATDEALSKDYPTTPEGLAEMEADAKVYGEACLENTGALLGHVDTQSSARDMDLIRELVGDKALNYLGYSYGVNCQQGPDCPLQGSVDDGLGQIKKLVDRAFDNPLSTQGERRLTSSLAFAGIAVALYDDQSWSYLTQALNAALRKNDGTVLLALADIYNDRNEDGTFASNKTEAFRAIGCADARGNSDPAHMAEQAAKILEVAPTLGEPFGYGALGCKNWPTPVAAIDYDISAPGTPPIVVIGTTDDPATPYEWATALSNTLDSGVLVSWKGEGHTAYGRSNDCIANAVEGFFLTGTAPDDGLQC